MSNSEDPALVERLAAALAAADDGTPIDVAALAAGRSELVPELAAALELSSQLPELHRQSLAVPLPDTELLAGRYRLGEELGRGAAGVVFAARDERLQRDVAVKLLHPAVLSGDEAAARFLREARTLAAIDHAHIVRIYDQGRSDSGTLFLVAERLRGASLQHVLDHARAIMPDGPAGQSTEGLRRLLPDASLEPSWLRQCVRWAAELADGLAAAHAKGIFHRDTKPSNAFVTTAGRAVLLDFGIAALAGDAAITRDHAVLGTPCYMAPEQARGGGVPSAALDVYGLGATLYHLLTHRPPHQGSLHEVLQTLRTDDPPPAIRFHPGLPRDLQAILDRAMARTPGHRYPTILAMAQDLRSFLAHQPVAARPLGPLHRVWRRVAARPARAVAIVSTTLVAALLLVALPAWSALRAADRAAERARRLAALPADLCIEGRPEVLAMVPLADRRAVLAELDALLALDGDDLGILVPRALAYLDVGETASAQRDLDAIRARSPSPYLAALVDRIRSCAVGPDGVATPDARDLPAPATTADFFVAGWLALRAGDCRRADALLTAAADWLPARDVRLLAILGLPQPDPVRAFAEAKELEGIYGRPTARTQHALGAAMLQQRDYAAAIPYCEQSLRLRPGRHGPLTNLGLARLRVGDLEGAHAAYAEAVRSKPWLDNSRSGLCQTLRRLGRWDEARACAEAMRDPGWRDYELGNLELARALAALQAGDTPQQRQAATAAAAHFAAAGHAATRHPQTAGAKVSQRLAEALVADDVGGALSPFLAELRTDPRNPRQIANLSALLGAATPDAEALLRLRLWLLDLALDLAPGDASLREQRASFVDSFRKSR